MKVVVSRLLVLLASLPSSWPVAQAFQLQNNNHLVSLTHHPNDQQQQTQPLPLPLPKKKPSSYSPETAATQINRTVNRNTKNRQNHSTCSFDKPHSTLLEIVQHNNSNTKKNESIKRSLRQLGITIASLFIAATQQRMNVANAYTPLIVTHPSTGSTAVTPLLSTLPPSYHGVAIVPSALMIKGLSPAIGEIIMSFAYVIIALGVSHMLAHVAEGGHVKVLKLMAWQNLFDTDDDTTTTKSTTASSSSTATKGSTNIITKMGNEIQGLFSRYIYMIQLIFSEIHRAYNDGRRYQKELVLATPAPMATSSPSSRMLSRYASNLNLSFQDIFKTHHEERGTKKKEDVWMNWEEYSKLLQQKNKKKGGSKTRMKLGRSGKKGDLVYNKYTMMFERVAKSDTEAEATKKATDLFKQKQYEQHHHRVHVPRNEFEESTKYLDSLTKFGEGEEQQHKHPSKGYLDTLSEEQLLKSSWEVYKGQVEKVKKEAKHQNEVEYLKEELAHIQSLLQDEQSMYQTSNQALNLVVEAQNEELKHARSGTTHGQQHSTTVDELKEFDIKAKEYEEAMKESKKVESGGGSTTSSTSPDKWIF